MLTPRRPDRLTARSAIAGALLGLLFTVAHPVAAAASVGVGVEASPIVLPTPAQPGHSYQLPSLYFVNTGTEASSYHLSVERISKGTELSVPPRWVTFASNDIRLVPRAHASVPLVLTVPANALAGHYVSDLLAGTVASPRSGVSAGAQAATELMFTVEGPAGQPFPWAWPWWTYAGLLGVVVFAVALWTPRRFGLRVRIERRR